MNKHNYRIFWDESSGEYGAVCTKYKLLSFFDPEPTTALKGLIDILNDIEEGDLDFMEIIVDDDSQCDYE